MARQSWKTYIARLKQAVTTSKQATVKHLGIGMMVMAMVLQSVVFFQDYAQAASDDMIQGGVGSKEAILAHYDKNTNNFRDVLTYNGITRAELANISSTKVRYEVDSSAQSWGWTSRFSEAQGQKPTRLPDAPFTLVRRSCGTVVGTWAGKAVRLLEVNSASCLLAVTC